MSYIYSPYPHQPSLTHSLTNLIHLHLRSSHSPLVPLSFTHTTTILILAMNPSPLPFLSGSSHSPSSQPKPQTQPQYTTPHPHLVKSPLFPSAHIRIEFRNQAICPAAKTVQDHLVPAPVSVLVHLAFLSL